jgi:hypothetical protein
MSIFSIIRNSYLMEEYLPVCACEGRFLELISRSQAVLGIIFSHWWLFESLTSFLMGISENISNEKVSVDS